MHLGARASREHGWWVMGGWWVVGGGWWKVSDGWVGTHVNATRMTIDVMKNAARSKADFSTVWAKRWWRRCISCGTNLSERRMSMKRTTP